MKNFLKTTIVMLVIQSMQMGQTFASARVDDVLSFDREAQVRKIYREKDELKAHKNELENIEQHLKRTRKGQNIYLRFQTIAGSIIVIGIVIGSYKAYFPPGFRAMLGAYLTVNGISRGLVKLSDKEVILLLSEIVILSQQISLYQVNLDKQLEAACEQVDQHPLCNIN